MNIEIHVSNFCNRNCSFCSFRFVKDGKKMSVKTAIAILEKYKHLETITYSGGGEPTTNNEVLSYLMDEFGSRGVLQGLITNGYQTAKNMFPLEWARLSVYSTNCKREIVNIQKTNAKKINAALFFNGIEDLKKYTFLLKEFDEVTVKSLNGECITDDDVNRITDLGFLCKKNKTKNDFLKCGCYKPLVDIDGSEWCCCLAKSIGKRKPNITECPVPCPIIYSNTDGAPHKNKYGFII